MALFSHLLLNLFTDVKLAKMGDFLRLVDLSLHEPIVHCLAAAFVLLPLALCDIKQLFFDLILCLAYEFALETFLSILGFKPIRVREATASESSQVAMHFSIIVQIRVGGCLGSTAAYSTATLRFLNNFSL